MKTISILALLAACLLVGCAGNSTRMLAPARPPINPEEVRIYQTAPAKYQAIAELDVTSGVSLFHGTAHGEAEAIQQLKVEAARLGANGVLVTLVEDRPSGAIGIGVGGGGIAGGRGSGSVISGGGSGAAPLVTNGARGIAIYVFDRR